MKKRKRPKRQSLLASLIVAPIVTALDTYIELIQQLTDADFDAQGYHDDGMEPFNVKSDSPYETFRSYSSDDAQNQWLYIALGQSVHVKGMLIITDQDNMTGGQFSIFVYSDSAYAGDYSTANANARYASQCEIQNDVGVNGQGGAFNCNKYGKYIWIECITTCTPYLAIGNIRAWTYEILSHENSTFYIPSTLSTLSLLGTNYDESSFPTIIGPGAIWESSSKGGSGDVLTITDHNNLVTWTAVAVEIPLPSVIMQVYVQSSAGLMKAYVTDDDTLGVDFTGLQSNACSSGDWTNTGSSVTSCDMVGKHITFIVTQTEPSFWLEKIVIVGYVCDRYPVQLVLTDYGDDENCVEIQSPISGSNNVGVTLGPECALDYPSYYPSYVSGYTFEFKDYNYFPGGTVDYITASQTGATEYSFQYQVSQQVWDDYYPTKPIQITIVVIIIPNTNGTIRQRWPGGYSIYLNDDYDNIGSVCGTTITVDSTTTDAERCEAGDLIKPDAIDELETTVLADDAVVFTFPEVQDSGSISNGDSTGLSSCGARTYALINGGSFMTLKGRELSLQTSNPADSGSQTVQIEVNLDDYPNVEGIYVDIAVSISECKVSNLVEPSGISVSPYNLVLELPASQTFDMPLFEPYPLCGYSNTDVSYQLTLDNDSLPPTWLKINADKHQIELNAVEDDEVYGQKFQFQLKATFANLYTETQKFKVVFSEKAKEEVIDEKEDVDEKETVEDSVPNSTAQTAGQSAAVSETEDADDQPVEENVAELLPSEINGWDGWKILLQQLGLDFELPRPRTDVDPNYVPTNPKVSIGKISELGKVIVKFSEPVFELQDVTTKTIGKRRMLAPKPFLDIQIKAGEMSDPELLGFNTTVSWPDDKTIEVSMIWSKATAISSSQPEEELVLNFYGPFFDQEDGLPLESSNTQVSKKIPPQVVPGALTDAVAAAGSSLQASSTGFLAGNAVMNIFLQGSLNQVWGMINNLQMIIHAPLINIQFPGNAFMLYDVMLTVASFDILPTDIILPEMFPFLNAENPFSEKFERMGYETQYIIMNMGTMFFVFLMNNFLLIIYVPLRLCGFKFKIPKVFAKKIERVMFYRWQIVFIQEAYLDLFLAVCINLYSFGDNWWGSFEDNFNNVVVIIVLVELIALPVVILAYICPNYRKLKKDRFMDKYGAIYDMVDLRHKNMSALLWCVFFIGRRVAFSVGCIFFKDFPVFQIYLFIFSTLAVLMMVGLARPLPTPFDNKLEMYNNFSILVLSYCLLCFTPFVIDPDTRYDMGYIMILLTIQNILVGLVFIGIQPIKMIHLRMKRCIIHRAYKKKMGIKPPARTPFTFAGAKSSLLGRFKTFKAGLLEEDEPEPVAIELQKSKRSIGNLSVIKEDVSKEIDSFGTDSDEENSVRSSKLLKTRHIDTTEIDQSRIQEAELKVSKTVRDVFDMFPSLAKQDKAQLIQKFKRSNAIHKKTRNNLIEKASELSESYTRSINATPELLRYPSSSSTSSLESSNFDQSHQVYVKKIPVAQAKVEEVSHNPFQFVLDRIKVKEAQLGIEPEESKTTVSQLVHEIPEQKKAPIAPTPAPAMDFYANFMTQVKKEKKEKVEKASRNKKAAQTQRGFGHVAGPLQESEHEVKRNNFNFTVHSMLRPAEKDAQKVSEFMTVNQDDSQILGLNDKSRKRNERRNQTTMEFYGEKIPMPRMSQVQTGGGKRQDRDKHVQRLKQFDGLVKQDSTPKRQKFEAFKDDSSYSDYSPEPMQKKQKQVGEETKDGVKKDRDFLAAINRIKRMMKRH